jgi:hypothetical protein
VGKPPTNGNNQVILAAHPAGAVQAGIAVAHDAIGSLGAQPVLLLIVLLNLAFVVAAAYFLATLETSRVGLVTNVLDIVKVCVVQKATPTTLSH